MTPNKLKLKVKWSKKEQDFIVYYPRSSDGHFIHSSLLSKRLVSLLKSSISSEDLKSGTYTHHEDASWNKNIAYWHWDWLKELDNRGFDLTTLKFEITIKKDCLANKFSHIWDDLSPAEQAEALKLGFKKP